MYDKGLKVNTVKTK